MTHAPTEPISSHLRSASPHPVTLLRVYGEDASSYLQSQVSADLRVSGEHWVRYALWLDASGHVLADTFILRQNAESFLLFSYATPAEQLEEIVLSNVIADDVEVEHLGSGYRHWALWAGNTAGAPASGLAPATASAAANADLSALAEALGSPAAKQPTLLFAGRNAAGENYDLLIPESAALPPAVAALPEVPWAQREARRIADGVPAIPADIGTGDLPQEGGDLARVAVSTSKGCYLGQEVIARWHATGQVRSGLFRVRLLAGKTLAGAATGSVLESGAVASLSKPDVAAGSVSGTAEWPFAPALPARLYAGTKPVGELRSYTEQGGAGLALLRIHRLGDARALGLEAGGEAVLEVIEPMLS